MSHHNYALVVIGTEGFVLFGVIGACIYVFWPFGKPAPWRVWLWHFNKWRRQR